MKYVDEMIQAILLLGPTGAGKSPLGEEIQKNGISGRRCFHFDFGNELRSIASLANPPEGFEEKEHLFIRDVLEKGLLLENEHFHIAAKIIRCFKTRNNLTDDDSLILNGLPRHVDQAKDLSTLVTVRRLVVLDCSPEVVYQRISGNTGGDRTGRTDDELDLIKKKLEIFRSRTTPLIDYYSAMGCYVTRLEVTELSTPENTYDAFISVCNT